MRVEAVLAGLTAAGVVSAIPAPLLPQWPSSHRWRRNNSTDASPNPFDGKKLFANPAWAEKLEATYKAFTAQDDAENAAKVRAAQKTGTFVWVSDRAGLANIDDAVAAARKERDATGADPIVGLVLYNLPDRDCSAGESAGELSSDQGGLQIYKDEFVKPYADKLAAADDLTFAVVVEPDSLPNLVTNQDVEFCAKAGPVYEEGIAHAIASLQFDHVHLYLDAAHGGWLGWDPNLPLAAKEFSKVVRMAGNNTKIRGFSTNVSNYNPFNAARRDNFTKDSHAWDESHYATALAPHLETEGLPSRFIIDQGRVALPGARKEWGDWCNVNAGLGMVPGTPTNNTLVDSVVWVKPGGESDGECGMEGAPKAGAWFDEYVQALIKNADPSLKPAQVS